MVDNEVMREFSEKYSEIRSKLGFLIQESGLTDIEIAKRLRIPLANFLAKKANADWTEKQIQRVLYFIDNDELEDFYMVKIMESVEKEDDFMTSEELKMAMGWK